MTNYQIVDLHCERRDEPDGTATLRFTLTGLEPRQLEDIGNKLATAVKQILRGHAEDGEVIMRSLDEQTN